MKYRIILDGFDNYIPQFKYWFWPRWLSYKVYINIDSYQNKQFDSLYNAIIFIEEMQYNDSQKSAKNIVVWP